MGKKIRIARYNLRALRSYRSKAAVLQNLPTYFWIEPTNHCNLHCIMCPSGAGKVEIEKGFMALSFFRQIIDQIRPYASAVTLAVNGESLLHPDFFQMVRYTRDAGIKVILNTNATLMRAEQVDEFLDCGISSVSFAFDGFTPSMYEKARVGARFDDTLENILRVLRRKKERGLEAPYTVLSMLQLELEDCSDKEKADFLNRFDGLIDEIRVREVSTWGKSFQGTQEFAYRDNRVVHPPCSRLYSTAVITWNGDVVPCIYNSNHEYLLGNLHRQSLKEIWNAEPMLRLRRAMLDGTYLNLLPLCENCIVLGSPPLLGIPSGLRLSLADAATNFAGYRVERLALALANRLRRGKFTARTIR